jgi:hypothetical protein
MSAVALMVTCFIVTSPRPNIIYHTIHLVSKNRGKTRGKSKEWKEQSGNWEVMKYGEVIWEK